MPKNARRKRGRPSKLSHEHVQYLKRLKIRFAGSPQVGQDIWDELERQAAEPLLTPDDLDRRITRLAGDQAFREQCQANSPEDAGMVFMGQRPTLKAGQHYAGHGLRLVTAILQNPDAPENSIRKRRLLRALNKPVAKVKPLARAILDAVYSSQKWIGDERPRAQAFLDLANQRTRRKKLD